MSDDTSSVGVFFHCRQHEATIEYTNRPEPDERCQFPYSCIQITVGENDVRFFDLAPDSLRELSEVAGKLATAIESGEEIR